MSKESYVRGFCKAAEAQGVDPNRLAEYIQKSAKSGSTAFSDYALALPGSMLVGAVPGGNLVNTGAYIAGLASDLEDEKAKKEQAWRALIPGLGTYRIANRIREQVRNEVKDIEGKKEHEGARPVGHAVAEHLGKGTSLIASALLGAGAGAGC